MTYLTATESYATKAQSCTIAPQPVDEVEKASIELAQHLEAQARATASQPIPTKGFRKGHAEHAAEVSESIKEFTASGIGAIWQIADKIAQMRSQFNRKEFRAFVSDLLEWTGSEARKYLDIERAFRGIEFSRLAKLEPFTLLRLRTKRYAPVVERLRADVVITPRSVQELIKELLPKQPRKKEAGNRDQAALQRHPNIEDGTFYYTLKNANLSDRAGLWLEQQLETQTVGQVLERAESRESEIEERDRRIAELETRLAQFESAQTAERVEVAPETTPHPEVPQTWEEFAQSVQSDRSILLDTVKDWTPERKQRLPSLLAAHLEENPNRLDEIAHWVPVKLLKAACVNLSFNVRKIVGPNNLVDPPSVQWIRGCRFVSLEYFNTRNEQWIFVDRENKRYPVFGRDEFAIAQF